MMTLRQLTPAATAILALAAMASCATDTTTTPSGTSSAPEPSISKTATSDSEKASSAVETLTQDYFATVDKVRQDPGVGGDDLKKYAAGTQLTAQQGFLDKARKLGQRQTGSTRLTKVLVQSINLSAKPATATVDACWDVSDVDVLDASGKSVVSPSRPDTGGTRFTVTQMTATDPATGWRITNGRDLEKQACAAS